MSDLDHRVSDLDHQSGVPLMIIYTALVIVGELLAWVIGGQIERYSPAASLPAFLALFFAVLLLVWPLSFAIARRVTPVTR